MDSCPRRKRGRPKKLSITDTVLAVKVAKKKKATKNEKMFDDGWIIAEEGTFLFDENKNLAEKHSIFLLSRRPDLFEVFDILFGGKVAETIERTSECSRTLFFSVSFGEDGDARSRVACARYSPDRTLCIP